MDLLSYWQLRERPFESVWDSRFFFHSPAHDEALNRLRYLASEQTMNVGLLTGEIGCGKTLTCGVFREQLDPSRYCVASFDHGQFEFSDIVIGLLDALGEPPTLATDHFSRWKALAAGLERLAASGRHMIAIFDEAQDFSLETFARLKSLTNFNRGGCAPMTLVFAGHPELQLRMAEVPSLGQRIGLLFHLRPLNRPETDAYLDHRMSIAGNPTGQVFSEDARQSLFEVSRGIPREINRLAKLAIEYAWVTGQEVATSAAIQAVVADDNKHSILASL